MTTIMKTDWAKLKREIHSVTAMQRHVGDIGDWSDLALYATYLYCIASQARGHLHMKNWNIHQERKLDTIGHIHTNPRNFQTTINNLDDQKAFIDIARGFIEDRQNLIKKYKNVAACQCLPLDFLMEITVEDQPTQTQG